VTLPFGVPRIFDFALGSLYAEVYLWYKSRYFPDGLDIGAYQPRYVPGGSIRFAFYLLLVVSQMVSLCIGFVFGSVYGLLAWPLLATLFFCGLWLIAGAIALLGRCFFGKF